VNKRIILLMLVSFFLYESGSLKSEESSEDLLNTFHDSYTNPKNIDIHGHDHKELSNSTDTSNWADSMNLLNSFAQRFLPFSFEEEKKAVAGDKIASAKVIIDLRSMVNSYSSIIQEASMLFDVPESIIAAVIIIESSGRADAKNTKSSASGLMQIINGTFYQIQKELKNNHNIIVSDRFKPKDNIFAGTYYLNKMFKIANNNNQLNRNNVAHWEQALRFYFAGPGYETLDRKYDPQKGIIMLKYSGGAQIPIDAPEKYSDKGLRFARLIVNAQA
jgi:soluble lytic murein transglycosylase-like protein